MKRFLLTVDTFTNKAGECLGWVLVLMVGIVSYEVILRFCFNRPTNWAHETTALVFGVYAILAGGYVFLHQRHIRVDIFWSRLSPRKQAVIDLATSGFAFVFLVALVWFSIPFAWHSFQIREVSNTTFAPPIYPTKIFLAIGAIWLLLQVILKFIRDLYTVRGYKI